MQCTVHAKKNRVQNQPAALYVARKSLHTALSKYSFVGGKKKKQLHKLTKTIVRFLLNLLAAHIPSCHHCRPRHGCPHGRSKHKLSQHCKCFSQISRKKSDPLSFRKYVLLLSFTRSLRTKSRAFSLALALTLSGCLSVCGARLTDVAALLPPLEM